MRDCCFLKVKVNFVITFYQWPVIDFCFILGYVYTSLGLDVICYIGSVLDFVERRLLEISYITFRMVHGTYTVPFGIDWVINVKSSILPQYRFCVRKSYFFSIFYWLRRRKKLKFEIKIFYVGHTNIILNLNLNLNFNLEKKKKKRKKLVKEKLPFFSSFHRW